MSFVKRALSSLGIGATTVDTIIFGDHFMPGSTLNGVVMIYGGELEQQIDEIYFLLNTSYYSKADKGIVKKTMQLTSYQINEPLLIGPGEEKELPLSIQLPSYTPLTLGDADVWVQTGLDIQSSVDPSDNDYIQIVPNDLVNALFYSLDELGFELNKVTAQPTKYYYSRFTPLLQEFEFRPISGPFKGRLDELEIVMFVSENNVNVFMEVDRRARGLSGLFVEALALDETKVQFAFGKDDLPDLKDLLFRHINSYR